MNNLLACLRTYAPTLIRTLLKVGGGILIAKGMTDQSTWETVSAGAIAISGILWGSFDANRLKNAKEDSLALPVGATPQAPSPAPCSTSENSPSGTGKTPLEVSPSLKTS